MAKAGTEAEFQFEVGAETDYAAADTAADTAAVDAAAADIGAAAVEAAAGEAAAVPCRQQAADVVLPQQPSGHLGGLCLVGKKYVKLISHNPSLFLPCLVLGVGL